MLFEQQFHVAAQVIDGLGGDLRAALGLGEDEGALQHRLHVQGEALGAPWRFMPRCCMAAAMSVSIFSACSYDGARAGIANGGIGLVRLLHHRSGEAGELGYAADEDRFAEIDVAEQAISGSAVRVVGRAGKQGAGRLRPEVGGGDGEVFLAFEVVEEGALGDAGGGAQVIDAGGRVALGADHGEGGAEDLGAGGCLGGEGHAVLDPNPMIDGSP